MSWTCNLKFDETDFIQDAPVVADYILKRMDVENKGWTYDAILGYTFFGSVAVTEDVVENGKLAIKFNEVGGSFECRHLELTSLEGSPQLVFGYFSCECNRLTSLKGAPEVVFGDFGCAVNQLTSLEGCPKKVGGCFGCIENAVKFTADDVEAVCEVGKAIYV